MLSVKCVCTFEGAVHVVQQSLPLSEESIVAFLIHSSRATATWPFAAAMCSGVRPPPIGCSTAAPPLRSISTTAASPFAAATCSGVAMLSAFGCSAAATSASSEPSESSDHSDSSAESSA